MRNEGSGAVVVPATGMPASDLEVAPLRERSFVVERSHRAAPPSRRDRAAGENRSIAAARRKALEAALERGLEDTFPGSDPVAVTQPAKTACDKDGA